jgi:flagellar protein FlbT
MALLDSALACARADKCYQALRLARRVVRHEDAVLGRPAAPASAPAALNIA